MFTQVKEKFSHKKHRRGYTLVELLTVIAIIAIVAVVAIPSAIFIKNSLAIKEKNDYAKAIYMAAQANLSEMRADGRVTALQVPDNSDIGAKSIPIDDNAEFPLHDWSSEYMYVTTGCAAYDLVLPTGSVEDSLRDKSVLIEYNPYTANVYSVFYSEGSEPLSYSNVSRDEDTRKKLELGYYCGSGLSGSIMEIVESKVSIDYKNGEEGVLVVSVPIPEEYYEAPTEFANLLTTTVSIYGESMKKTVYDNEGNPSEVKDTDIPSGSINDISLSEYDIVGGRYVEYTYTLDRLIAGKGFGSLAHNTPGTLLSSEKSEGSFNILPGQNIVVTASAQFNVPGSDKYDPSVTDIVTIASDTEYGINPLFEYMVESSTSPGRYVVAVSNGRNLQNLNAMAPSVAKKIETVLITDDINWNDTVSHYAPDVKNGGTSDAPLCDLPYFVPIHNRDLFGSAEFVYPEGITGTGSSFIDAIITALGGEFDGRVPTLSDEVDSRIDPATSWTDSSGNICGNTYAENHAHIIGNNGEKKIIGINIDTAKYKDHETSSYYVGEVDYSFTGVFSYINAPITDISLVNPIVRGSSFTYKDAGNYLSNPATGSLVGCVGYNTILSGCRVYIDKNDPSFDMAKMAQTDYSSTDSQQWYGVSGEGAVGGLVGYAKSHRTTTGTLSADSDYLAFINCFAAVPVSGNMRGVDNGTKAAKDFGYSNGIGGLVGNSQLTNFYNCYASGNVRGYGAYAEKKASNFFENMIESIFSVTSDISLDGRTGMGVGGFVGTSHGTRYTNCFATGNVSATNDHSNGGSTDNNDFWESLKDIFDFIFGFGDKTDYRTYGSGGFVGFMCYDETMAYGNDEGLNVSIAQNTVFTDCYSVGRAVIINEKGEQTSLENFAGAVGRIRLILAGSKKFMGDYYELYAPLGGEPSYGEDYYIYRHSYYLSNYYIDSDDIGRENSKMCSKGEGYDSLTKLHTKHREDAWVTEKINYIKALPTTTKGETYNDRYFSNNGMTDIYKSLYNEGFSEESWGTAALADTYSYDVERAGQAYPFSMLKGMPYYGCWPDAPVSAGLAYYETYYAEDGEEPQTVYFPLNSESVTISEDFVVTDDGYVVFIANDSEKDETASANITVTIGTYTWNLSRSEIVSLTERSRAYSYSVFTLPAEYLEVDPADGEYYVPVSVIFGNTIYELYFNPDAGMSQVNPPDFNAKDNAFGGITVSALKPEKPTTILIRSARQLAKLSELDACLEDGVTYIQQLNVDSSVYKTPVDTSFTVDILDGTYMGSSGYANPARIIGFTPEKCAFFMDVRGTVKDISIVLGNTTITGDTNAAIVAGIVSGTLYNVDVLSDSTTVTIAADENAGLIAGKSEGGIISGCDVDVLSAELTAKNSGGIVGSSVSRPALGDMPARNAEIKNCTVNLGTFNSVDAAYSGGIVGRSENTDISDTTTAIVNYMSNKAVSGGIAGYAKNGSCTSLFVTITKVYDGSALFGGLTGDALGVSITDSKVNITTLTADAVAGAAGKGNAISARNISVTLGSATGKNYAAGFAVELLSDNIESISAVSIHINEKITSTQGDAAGFAYKMNGSIKGCTVYLGKNGENSPSVLISGKNAAGFAIISSATVYDCDVGGKGNITADDKAAGFIVNAESDSIFGSIVTPVYGNDLTAYPNNGLDMLTITGKNAAGFAITSKASLKSCASLGTIAGENAAGFILTNGGPVDMCQANTSVRGSAFIDTNDHTVYNSYAWYSGSGVADSLSEGEMGAYFGCFFAPLKEKSEAKSVNVALFPGTKKDNDGRVADIVSLDQINLQLLNGSGNVWSAGGRYSTYFFNSELANSSYSYPMIGPHYGDWTSSARLAYGIAYFEELESGNINLNLLDVSNKDGDPNIYGKAISFNNVNPDGNYADGEIVRAGYAVLCTNTSSANADTQDKLPAEKLNLTGLDTNAVSEEEFRDTYDLYVLSAEGSDTVTFLGPDENEAATYIPAYANTVNDGDGHYDIRTPEQFAEMNDVYTFHQRHSLDLTGKDFSAPVINAYYGHGHTVTTDKKLFSNVSKSVSTITVMATGMSESLIGNVGADAEITTVYVSVSGETGYNGGGVLAAQNNGRLSDCKVFSGTSDRQTPANINITGAVFGGLIGTNTGIVENSTVNADITYKGSASTTTVGGLVGQMNGGSVTGCSTFGRIASEKSGVNFAAGGVIGTENTDASVAVYRSTASTMFVDASLKGSGDTRGGNTTAGMGKVGTFVGYVYNGQFVSCSTTDAGDKENATFHFLGEIFVESVISIDSGWYESASAGKDTIEIMGDSQNDYNNKLTDAGLKKTDDSAVYTYLARISGCRFEYCNVSKAISIDTTENYYSANETHESKQEGEYLKQTKETKETTTTSWETVSKKYSDIATGSKDEPAVSDKYFYNRYGRRCTIRGWKIEVNEGFLWPVWVTYYYIQYQNNDGQWIDLVDGSRKNDSISLDEKIVTTTTEIITKDPEITSGSEYIILGKNNNGELYSLNVGGNGNAIANKIENGDLSTAHKWKMETVSGWYSTSDTWVSVQNSSYKLRLYYRESWYGTTINVLGTGNYDITTNFVGNDEDGDGNGLFTFKSDNGYLTFNNGSFSVNSRSGSEFILYEVTGTTEIHIGTFEYETSGQRLNVD